MYFLPEPLKSFVGRNIETIYEIRIRKDRPVYVNMLGKFKKLVINGSAVIISQSQLTEIINRACEYSIYKHNESIKSGYLTVGGGLRIGLAGECVYEGGEIKTIKNFTSVSIRIPHEKIGYGDKAFNIIYQNDVLKSLLIIAPPSCGKTTLIRDLVRIISDVKSSNILVVDEKNEIFYDCVSLLETVDVLSSCKKEFAFYSAVKTLSPDVIVCDELIDESDANGVRFAINSGVKVIASVHADCIQSLMSKQYIRNLLRDNCFEKFILINRLFEYKEVFVK